MQTCRFKNNCRRRFHRATKFPSHSVTPWSSRDRTKHRRLDSTTHSWNRPYHRLGRTATVVTIYCNSKEQFQCQARKLWITLPHSSNFVAHKARAQRDQTVRKTIHPLELLQGHKTHILNCWRTPGNHSASTMDPSATKSSSSSTPPKRHPTSQQSKSRTESKRPARL